MKRIIVSVSNDINNDQRLYRTCITLQELNYELFLIGRVKKNSQPLEFPFVHKRFKMLFTRGFLFYAFFNLRLFFELLFSRKDVLYANDLDTLLPNYLVSRLQNIPLVFDSHELFSEVPELENKPVSKYVWKLLENWIIPKLKNVITVSPGIRDYYEKNYGITAEVIRNVPIEKRTSDKKLDITSRKQKIAWYQGAVNIGRGLELMIDTISLLNDHILVVAGDGDVLEQLEEKVLASELENKVKFLGKLSPEELKQLIPNASVGLSLEEDLGLNYRFALPNKLFDYIHAHVPVIVSNLPDMSSIVNEFSIGEVLEDRNPKELSKLILKVSDIDYSKSLKKAKTQLNWNREKNKLIKIIRSV